MHISLPTYLLSFSEKTLSGELTFPSDKAIQIIELKVLQTLHKKYCIGKIEIMSVVGESNIEFTIPIKPRTMSLQLETLMDKKLKQIRELINEEASLYALQVQYIQEKRECIDLFPLLIGD